MNTAKLFTGIGVFALAVFGLSIATATPPTDDPRCEGLSGAAFGLCTAATNVGCGGDDPQPNGCDRIAEKCVQITGDDDPPWNDALCTQNSDCAVGDFCKKADGDCEGTGICAKAEYPATGTDDDHDLSCFLGLAQHVEGCDWVTYATWCAAYENGTSVHCYHFEVAEPYCP